MIRVRVKRLSRGWRWRCPFCGRYFTVRGVRKTLMGSILEHMRRYHPQHLRRERPPLTATNIAKRIRLEEQ